MAGVLAKRLAKVQAAQTMASAQSVGDGERG